MASYQQSALGLGYICLLLSAWFSFTTALDFDFCAEVNTASMARSMLPVHSVQVKVQDDVANHLFPNRHQHIPDQRPLPRFLFADGCLCHNTRQRLLVFRLFPRGSFNSGLFQVQYSLPSVSRRKVWRPGSFWLPAAQFADTLRDAIRTRSNNNFSCKSFFLTS